MAIVLWNVSKYMAIYCNIYNILKYMTIYSNIYKNIGNAHMYPSSWAFPVTAIIKSPSVATILEGSWITYVGSKIMMQLIIRVRIRKQSSISISIQLSIRIRVQLRFRFRMGIKMGDRDCV